VNEEHATRLLDIIEALDLLIAVLLVDGQDDQAQEAKDIIEDLYYLYSDFVKHE
jgi:hypothetical protein